MMASAQSVPRAAGDIAHELAFAGVPERRLLTVYRAAVGRPRAAFVLCPPFFHEQFLSYRLLSLVAARLAGHGIASLRFDYCGTGDSWGGDTAFTLDGALADAQTALAELARRVPDVPLIAFGARAGAWVAARLALQQRLGLWLWQPIRDGSAWLAELVAMDERERTSRQRYPFMRKRAQPADPERLLASHCPPSLRSALAAQQLDAMLTSAELEACVVDVASAPALASAARWFELPDAAAHWHEYIDLHATFITPAVAACIDALAEAAPHRTAA